MKDRYVAEPGMALIRDLSTGELISYAEVIGMLNANERVLARVIEVVEQREEA